MTEPSIESREKKTKNREEEVKEEDLTVGEIDMDIDFGDVDEEFTDECGEDCEEVAPTDDQMCGLRKGEVNAKCPNMDKLKKCANLRESKDEDKRKNLIYSFCGSRN